MTHCMIDLETWGTRPGSAIRSIGAVIFDPWREGYGAAFYANLDPASCIRAGLTIDPATAEWWEGQSPEARAHLREGKRPLEDVLGKFHQWCRRSQIEFVWGHGASFDLPILEAACVAANVPVPWKFWDVRDTRTLFDLAKVSLTGLPREGTHHNALDDAKHQALVVQIAYKKLGITG